MWDGMTNDVSASTPPMTAIVMVKQKNGLSSGSPPIPPMTATAMSPTKPKTIINVTPMPWHMLAGLPDTASPIRL